MARYVCTIAMRRKQTYQIWDFVQGTLLISVLSIFGDFILTVIQSNIVLKAALLKNSANKMAPILTHFIRSIRSIRFTIYTIYTIYTFGQFISLKSL